VDRAANDTGIGLCFPFDQVPELRDQVPDAAAKEISVVAKLERLAGPCKMPRVMAPTTS